MSNDSHVLYTINDVLTALNAQLGGHADDGTLNDLTHHVAQQLGAVEAPPAEPVSGGALRAALAAVRDNGFGDCCEDDSTIEQAAQAALDGVVLTREQLEDWAGHPLTDDQVEDLDECIPNSSIPEAIATIVSETLGGDTKEEGA